MTIVVDDVEDAIRLEFELARQDLVLALRAQQLEDTPGARIRVANARSRIDSLLDMWNAGRSSA